MSAGGTFTGTNQALKTGEIGSYPQAKYAAGNVYCSLDECYASGTSLGAGSVMTVGKLPAGAVVLYSIVTPIDTATFGAPDATANAVTGTLGIAGDTNLFGAVTTLAATTPQIVVPSPDGTVYTTTVTNALASDVDVIFTSADAELVATEGIRVAIFYTM
jgi:hypothetical protein